MQKRNSRIFGWRPKAWLPACHYNSICTTVGAFCITSTWLQFVGLVLILEGLIVSIERCWPKEERP